MVTHPTDSAPSRGTNPHPVADRFHAGMEEEEEGKRNGGHPSMTSHRPRATEQPVDNPGQAPGQVMDGQIHDEPLFPGYEPPTTEPAEYLSAGQRLTRRQTADIRAGRHPLSLKYLLPIPLHPDADRARTATSPQDGTPTCGTCELRQPGGWPKCTQPDAPRSHGPATDCRAWWPACIRYSPQDGA